MLWRLSSPTNSYRLSKAEPPAWLWSVWSNRGRGGITLAVFGALSVIGLWLMAFGAWVGFGGGSRKTTQEYDDNVREARGVRTRRIGPRQNGGSRVLRATHGADP